MKKIILSCAVSLDGYIEGPDGEYDWCPPPSKKSMEDLMSIIDTICMGRISYEVILRSTAQRISSMFPGKKVIVFSNLLQKSDNSEVEVRRGDAVIFLRDFQKNKGSNIWLFGGANLTTSLLNAGLINEMWLTIVPIVLGSGKPLFQNISQPAKFKLASAMAGKESVSLTLTK